MLVSPGIRVSQDTPGKDIQGEGAQWGVLVREGWTSDRRRSCSREAFNGFEPSRSALAGRDGSCCRGGQRF